MSRGMYSTYESNPRQMGNFKFLDFPKPHKYAQATSLSSSAESHDGMTGV